MKLYKNASGKDVVSIEKDEWARIGLEKGWMKTKAQVNSQPTVEPTIEYVPVWQCGVCGRTEDAEAFKANDNECPHCDSPYIKKFQ